jgi:putative flippase GtrA
MFNSIFNYIKKYHINFFRFAIVGVITFVIKIFLFWIFHVIFNIHYQLSISLAYFLTVFCHFNLNRFFTYGLNNKYSLSVSASRYICLLAFNYLIVLIVVTFTVDMLGLSPFWGILFSTLMTGLSSFLIMNHFVFSRKIIN